MLGLRPTVPDLKAIEAEIIAEHEERITRAMDEAAAFLQNELRDQVLEAGMGRRLANTWRRRVYPEHGRSLNPAGLVWSRAPNIVDSFNRGVTIRARGRKYLAIPTRNVPRDAEGKRLTPDETARFYNGTLVFKPSRKRGAIEVFVKAVKAKSGKGYRPATTRRLAQGRKARLIHVFTLISAARMPRLFNFQEAADRASAYLAMRL